MTELFKLLTHNAHLIIVYSISMKIEVLVAKYKNLFVMSFYLIILRHCISFVMCFGYMNREHSVSIIRTNFNSPIILLYYVFVIANPYLDRNLLVVKPGSNIFP